MNPTMTRTIFAAIFGWTALLFGGCDQRSARDVPVTATSEERITAALQEVLERDDAPFAIIEHASTGKLAQFAGSASEDLLLDLPAHGLSEEEHQRAEALFSSLGGSHVDGPSPHEEPGSFQLKIGRDAEEAARITLRVFREVYQLPEDAVLTVTVDS